MDLGSLVDLSNFYRRYVSGVHYTRVKPMETPYAYQLLACTILEEAPPTDQGQSVNDV